MRLGQVLADRALALVEVGHGVEPEAVQAEVEPEAEHLEHRFLDLGVVVVEVGLVGEEPVPVVGAGRSVPRPVRGLGVDEDDPRVLVASTVSDHTYQSRLGLSGPPSATPGTTGGRRGVVHDQVGDHADPPRVRGVDQLVHVVDVSVVRVTAVKSAMS